jgi:DNA-binding response OmpR family regulator
LSEGGFAGKRILVVDDESAERISLADILRIEGYSVSTAASGEEALALARREAPFDLAVLDIKMPGIDGVEAARAIRQISNDTAVILLTAFGSLETAIKAIRQGADDYLLKPSPVDEILRSVRQALSERERTFERRRLVGRLQNTISELVGVENGTRQDTGGAPEAEHVVKIREVTLDRGRHAVDIGGRLLNLTPTEFRIVDLLMCEPDRVWTPRELVLRAQGYEADEPSARAIIRVHIRRLRSKLEPDPSNPRYILNVRGVGYLFASKSPGRAGSTSAVT